MALNQYSIHFKKLIYDLLDTSRRTKERIAWLYSLLAGVGKTYNDFIAHSDRVKQMMKYSPGYKIQLEQLLNDTYGGGITITNHQRNVSANFLYPRGSLQNKGLHDRGRKANAYLYGRGAYDHRFVNFTVRIPAALASHVAQMKALINQFKRLGMTYNIITY